MFSLETDLSGISITRLGVSENEKGRACVFMYAMYKRACPFPCSDTTADNHLTRWTEAFITRSDGLTHFSLWEPGILYRLPQVALDELGEGDDLYAAPVRVELRHTPYPGFTVDEYGRGSADGKRDAVTTALHAGSYTPCIVAPRGEIMKWVGYLGSMPGVLPLLKSSMDRRHLGLSWLKPLLCTGDVRLERLPCLLDRPVELAREGVSRETA